MMDPPSSAGPAAPGRHGRIARGLGAKLASLAVDFGQHFVLVPIFAASWGADLYGDWLVLVSAASFLALADLGLQHYTTNRMQSAWSRDDPVAFARALQEGISAYLVIVSAAALIGLMATALLPWAGTLALGAAGADAVALCLGGLVLYTVAAIPTGMIFGVYRARGDYASASLAHTAQAVLLIGATILVLALGGGPAALAAAYLGCIVVIWVVTIRHQRRRYPGIEYRAAVPDRIELRLLITTAPFYLALPLGIALAVHGTVLAIAILGPAGAQIAGFTTVRTLANIVRSSTEQFAMIFGAELARDFARADVASLVSVYAFAGRFLAALAGGTAGAVAVLGPPFFAIWTRGRVPFDGWVLALLLGANALAAPMHTAEKLLMHISEPRGLALAYLTRGATTIALTLALAPWLGALGAAIAILIADAVIGGILLPRYARRFVPLAPIDMIARSQLIAVASFALSAAIAWAAAAAVGTETLGEIALIGCLWAAVLAPSAYFGLLSAAQRALLLARARAAWR